MVKGGLVGYVEVNYGKIRLGWVMLRMLSTGMVYQSLVLQVECVNVGRLGTGSHIKKKKKKTV